MITTYRNLLALALAAGVSTSTASAAVTIDWVTVGNPGNPADWTGYGAVGYEYQIARNDALQCCTLHPPQEVILPFEPRPVGPLGSPRALAWGFQRPR